MARSETDTEKNLQHRRPPCQVDIPGIQGDRAAKLETEILNRQCLLIDNDIAQTGFRAKSLSHRVQRLKKMRKKVYIL